MKIRYAELIQHVQIPQERIEEEEEDDDDDDKTKVNREGSVKEGKGKEKKRNFHGRLLLQF